ncbi:MAG TPA: phage/plasmid primase, P4 family, partial [Thermomicrobiaceae bacterium]|nr:phage/plasmid primase, P4 family [Thermomicrobiaceae bacterium]
MVSRPVRDMDHFDTVPPELRERPQWVVWRLVPRPGGKPDKQPINPHTGQLASSTDPATWSDFTTAWDAYQRGPWAGLGFVFAADDPYVGVDLDDCYDPVAESLNSWADEYVTRLDSYTEVSPSGTGVKLIVRAELPDDPQRKRYGRRTPQVEMYQAERFFTITGDSLWWTPPAVEERTEQLAAVYWRVFGTNSGQSALPRPTPLGTKLTDNEIINRAMRAVNGAKFARLWRGDTGDFDNDDSRADLALCSLLAFWTGPDASRIDSLFRQSGLYREKWNRADYREMTINQALNRTDYYEAGARMTFDGQDAPGDGQNGPERERFPLSDLGNAERLIARSGADMRYCDLWKRWLVWDMTHWRTDDTLRVASLAKTAVRHIYDEVGLVEDSEERKRLAKFAIASESSSRIKAMLELGQSEPGVPVTPDDLDADSWLLTATNGTIDLRTGALGPHDRAHLITKAVNAPYDPTADCPVFLAFLRQIMAGDEEMTGFLQRAIGYSLTGSIREQVAFIAWGAGSNGKSTLFDLLLDLLGDYAMQTPTDTLMAKRQDAIPNDVARLRGARFVAAVETEDGRRLSEPLVKQLTGGDRVTARFMRAEWFEFSPTFKLWLATNHKPVIRGTDHAIWRRIRLIPFTVTIAEADQDKELPAKLRAEMPGILRWAIDGCLSWQRDGLGVPEAV